MSNMDNFNHLLDGIDPICQEKLIIGAALALTSVSNERRHLVLQRSIDGIYSLRDGLRVRLERQPRNRNAVNRYIPYFIRKEVTRKKKKLKVNRDSVHVEEPAVSTAAASTSVAHISERGIRMQLLRPRTRSMGLVVEDQEMCSVHAEEPATGTAVASTSVARPRTRSMGLVIEDSEMCSVHVEEPATGVAATSTSVADISEPVIGMQSLPPRARSMSPVIEDQEMCRDSVHVEEPATGIAATSTSVADISEPVIRMRSVLARARFMSPVVEDQEMCRDSVHVEEPATGIAATSTSVADISEPVIGMQSLPPRARSMSPVVEDQEMCRENIMGNCRTAFADQDDDDGGAPHNGPDSILGNETVIMALIPSVGPAYNIPGFQLECDLANTCFVQFRRRVNQTMGVPNDYNGWTYFDSDYNLHRVDDDESYEAMWNEHYVNGGEILLIADEEPQHDYHLVLTHLLNKIAEDECRDRIFLAINFALSASRTKRELVLQAGAIGVRRYIIRSRA